MTGPVANDIRMMGLEIWSGRTPTADETGIARAINGWIARIAERDVDHALKLRASLSDGLLMQRMLLAATWARCAFPRIVMSHTYAAALCATAITADIHPLIKLPWDAFAIEIPSGFISGRTGDGEAYDVGTLFVHRLPKPKEHYDVALLATTGSTLALVCGLTRKGIVDEIAEDRAQSVTQFTLGFAPFGSGDGRVMHVLQRLTANVCLAMSDPANLKPLGKGKPHPPAKRKTGQPPLTTFQLGQSVEVDCRQAIRDYIEGREPKPGKALALQMLVRGHWKRQHHGERNAKVKIIWVQPYWRGPDTAPILTRPHVMPTDPRSPNTEVSHA